MNDHIEDIARWLLEGRTGISSKTMAAIVLGCDTAAVAWGDSHPHVPADALAAASRACVAHGRNLAGLPPLP